MIWTHDILCACHIESYKDMYCIKLKTWLYINLFIPVWTNIVITFLCYTTGGYRIQGHAHFTLKKGGGVECFYTGSIDTSFEFLKFYHYRWLTNTSSFYIEKKGEGFER